MAFSNRVAKSLLLWVVVCSIIMNCREAIAGNPISYNVRHYTDEDGLPENSVKAIRRDENGFIWFTTEDGLTRFDGTSFFVFNVENTGVSSNRFIYIKNELYQDRLYAYNLNDDYVRITEGKAVLDTAHNFSYEDVAVFFKSNRIEAPPHVALAKPTYIIPLAKQAFYLCTAEELFFYRNNRLVSSFPVDSEAVVKYERWRIFLLGQTLYYCNADGSISSFENGQTKTISLTGDILQDADYKQHKEMLKVLANTSGQSTLIFFKKSLYALIRKENGDIETHLLIEDFDFEHNQIVSAFYDDESGDVFLGSNINGLYVFSRKRFQTFVFSKKENTNNFYAQAAYSPNSIVTPGGNLINRNDGTSKKAFDVPFSYYNQYTILKDKQGYTWLTNNGLCRLDSDFKEAGRWPIPGAIIVLHEGVGDKIWVGTREGNIFYMNPKAPGEPQRLNRVFVGISYIVQQDEDILWVAGRYGLYRLHLKTMQIDTIKGLNNQYVRSLYLAKANQLWITTYENGLYLYDHDSLTHFPLDSDHFLMAAHCMVEDKRGYFWVTTNKGLFQVAKKDLLAYAAHQQQEIFYMYYNKGNGFNTNEFNGGCQPCGLISDSGDISFPSLDGLVWFSSGTFKEELPDKKIFIDKIELNNKSIPVSEEINLQQHFDLFNVSVSSPYYGDRRNVHMYYGLAEDNAKPVYRSLPANGVISLQNLSSGKYVLYIRKLNGFGKNNYTEKIIKITIPPYWFQTIWFFIGISILVLLIVYVFITIRTRFLLNKNRMLEILIRKRTLKLEQALSSLKTSQDAQAKQTFIQERLIAAISHDIRTPLKYLSHFNKKIYEKLLLETEDETLLEMSKSAADSSNRMQHYLGNLLQFVKTSLHKGNIKSDIFNLHDLVKEHVDMLADVAASNKTIIVNEVLPEQQISTNRQLLAIILHNIIDNAVKVTMEGTITITALRKEKGIEIIVADDGGGIAVELQDWVNNAFNATIASGNPENDMAVNTGMGLFIVKELAILINAQLHIVSDNTSKTEVHVFLVSGEW